MMVELPAVRWLGFSLEKPFQVDRGFGNSRDTCGFVVPQEE